MARRILTQAKPVTTELDKMIYQMETVLGKPHVASPFPALYKQYLVEEVETQKQVTVADVKPAEETKVAAKSEAKPEKK